jgi:hypothetical protein
MMNTNSDESSENRHQQPMAAGEPRPANGSGLAWPSRPVPAWSVPSGLLGSSADRPDSADRPESAEAALADPAPDDTAEQDDGWPGAAPPAGWFLRTPADRPAGAPAEPGAPAVAPLADQDIADGDESLTGEWFVPPALELDESPVSWSLDEADLSAPGASLTEQAAPPQPGGHGAVNGHQIPDTGRPRGSLPAEPVVGATRALRGRPGGPGFHPRRPDARTRRLTASQSPWQISYRLWAESEIPWELRIGGGAYQPQTAEHLPHREPATRRPAAHRNPPPSTLPPNAVPSPRTPAGSPPPPRNAPARHARTGAVPSEPANGAWPGPVRIPLGAPVFAGAQAGAQADAQASARDERTTEPASEAQPHTGHDSWLAADRPPPLWERPQDPALSPGHRAFASDTLLLEPELPDTLYQGPRRGLSRRTATIVVPVLVLVAVAVLALALLTGHGPKFGQLTASQPGA